jgi:RNA polymerase sigma-70 factor (ECF subfamily)
MENSTNRTLVGKGLERLAARVEAGDKEALAKFFSNQRSRLERMIELRMDRRLKSLIEPSDVLQEAFLDAYRRLPDYAGKPARQMPAFLWLRFLTLQRLVALHRKHFGATRNADLEISLDQQSPDADSFPLSNRLIARMTTAKRAIFRKEVRQKLEKLLDDMDAIDREVLVLRHFEELSNNETAALLGLSKAAASNRYIRALTRLKMLLGEGADLNDDSTML